MSGIREIGDENGVLFTSYVPEGWLTKCGWDEGEISARTPIVPVVLFGDPNNQAVIRFKGTAGFRHFEPNGFMQQNQTDSSLIRYRSFQTASDYCDFVFEETHQGAINVSEQNVRLTGDRVTALRQYQAKMSQMAGRNFDVYAEYVEKIYAYTEKNRMNRRCAVSAMIGALEPRQVARNVGTIFGSVAGFFGNMAFGENAAKDWERVFELVLDAEEGIFEQCYPYYLQINQTLMPTQGFFNLLNRANQMVQENQNYVNGVYANIANQQMQAGQRMAQTIRNT